LGVERTHEKAEVRMTGTSSGGNTPNPHADPKVWGPHLVRRLEAQLEQCRRLESLCERQREAVSHGHTDALLTVLAERQGAVDEMARIGEEIEPFRARWESVMMLVEPAIRDRMMELVGAIGDAIERVGRRDEQDRASLEQQRASVAGELAVVANRRGAVAAYGGAVGRGLPTSGSRQDREV
jgi:hypothetical protein